MDDDLDFRQHPEVNVKRRLLGMDHNAGLVVIMGALSFVIICGLAVSSGHFVLGLVGGGIVAALFYLFAIKFLNNRPPSYFGDWVESRRIPNYQPKKAAMQHIKKKQ